MTQLAVLSILLLVVLPVHPQVEDRLNQLYEECRLVRGHSHMIRQMVDAGDYNVAVMQAHFSIIERNLSHMEASIREIESLLSDNQKARMATELKNLYELCDDTKPIAVSLRQELDSAEVNFRRVGALATRINRNLRTAMEIQEAMKRKL